MIEIYKVEQINEIRQVISNFAVSDIQNKLENLGYKLRIGHLTSENLGTWHDPYCEVNKNIPPNFLGAAFESLFGAVIQVKSNEDGQPLIAFLNDEVEWKKIQRKRKLQKLYTK